MDRKGLLPFIRSTICPESNSNVKREMGILGGRSNSELSSRRRSPPTPLFSNGLKSRKQWAGHGGKESRTRVKVGSLPIAGGPYQS
jgi:hypothetical protein